MNNMILVLIVLVPIFLLSVWAFLRYSPRMEGRKGVLLFNLSVLVVGLLLCAFLTFKVYASMGVGPDRAWWPILSVLGTLVVFPVVLLVAGTVRNGVVFKPPNNHG